MNKIKLLALDIDGVLTDGRTALGVRAPERKRLAFQDLDAIHAAKRAGLQIALVTGESDGSVDLVAKRTGIETVRRGAKDKLAALQELGREMRLALGEIAYVGDGDRDAPALKAVGFSLAPTNAAFAARRAAHRLLSRAGGHGAVNEAVRLVLRWNDDEGTRAAIHRGLQQSLGRRKFSLKQMQGIEKLAAGLQRAAESGKKILVCGAGAEAAVEALLDASKSLPAVALAQRPATLLGQLRFFARAGDVVLVISSIRSGSGWQTALMNAEQRGIGVFCLGTRKSASIPGVGQIILNAGGDGAAILRAIGKTVAKEMK